MRILVTGSSGQIGSYVVDEVRRSGHEVRGLDLRPSKWTDYVGDVRDAAASERAIRDCQAVVHCAAQVSVPRSVADPVTDASHNVVGTVTLLQAARHAGAKRFVNVSSAAVYGTPLHLPIDESHPAVPLSPYGASKLAAEKYVGVFAALHGLETATVRPFNVYSVRQDPSSPYSGVLSLFGARVRAGQAPLVHGDGSQTRDFVHAEDVARWLVALATRPTPGPTTVNLGNGQATSILDVARLFMRAAGLAGEPIRGEKRVADIEHSVADVGVLRGLGLPARRTLTEGIMELVAPTT
jgi:UDP-glucose 4-epimerase